MAGQHLGVTPTASPASTPLPFDTATASEPVATKTRTPVFEPFQRGPSSTVLDTLPAWNVHQAAITIRDLAGGAAVVLQMVEQNLFLAEEFELEQDETVGQPLMSGFHQAALMRLAIAALHVVERDAAGLLQIEVNKP